MPWCLLYNFATDTWQANYKQGCNSPVTSWSFGLGVIITSGENEPTIMTFMKGVLPSYVFYGRNDQGPEICITDDSSAKLAALKMV